MNICLIGKNISNLLLAKNLANQGINFDLLYSKSNTSLSNFQVTANFPSTTAGSIIEIDLFPKTNKTTNTTAYPLRTHVVNQSFRSDVVNIHFHGETGQFGRGA